ncbi:MAG TPA: FAD binding domain-containing protein [Chloroflexota bacterium]|nr:FAD binding domain-containing protein [Chloroflexota bacterium]
MLRLTPFTYLSPTSIDAALTLLAKHGDEAQLMGGGTDLLPNIKHRLTEPRYVVGTRSIEDIKGIELLPSGELRIGGGVSLSELEHSSVVRERYPALAEAASLISSPQIRRMGTLAGNIALDVRCNYYNQSEHWRRAIGYCMKKDSEICRVAPGSDRCWAVSSADTVPVLIALDAEMLVVHRTGARWRKVASGYRDDGLRPLTLAPGSIIAHVRIPPQERTQTVYSKLRIRMSFDFPLVGAATSIVLAEDGTVGRARIVLTAVASHPLEVVEAEQELVGNRLTPDVIRSAGEKVFRATHPMDNTEGAIPHRKRMARVFVERALRQIGGLEAAPSAQTSKPAG